MSDSISSTPIAVVARAAYLRASGLDWPTIADKLACTKSEAEALVDHPEWSRLYRTAMRVVAREAEAEARHERRKAIRSTDEEESTPGAEETYRLRAKRRPAAKPAEPSDRERLTRAYLDCLNAMSEEEFRSLEADIAIDSNVTPP